MIDKEVRQYNKWSKKFDIRPHRRRTRAIQSYSPGGANVHPIYRKPKMVAMAMSLRTADSYGPFEPTTQTACRSVQPFLHR